jgi:hypothetical protein
VADTERRRQAANLFCRFGTILAKKLLSSVELDDQERMESLYEAFEDKLQSIARHSQSEGSLRGLKILRKVVHDLCEERVLKDGPLQYVCIDVLIASLMSESI